MRLIAVVLAALILTGCATSRPYTKGEKWALAGAFTGQAMDMGTTYYALREVDGMAEANPVWGSQPDDEMLACMAGSKLVLIGLAYLLGEWQPDLRTPMYCVLGGTGAAAGAWNTYQINQALGD